MAVCLQVVHARDRATGNRTTLVLTLSGPVYNASAGTLAFNVTPAAAGAKPKLQDGVAEKALGDARTVNLQAPAQGLLLTVRAGANSECCTGLGLAEMPEKLQFHAALERACRPGMVYPQGFVQACC